MENFMSGSLNKVQIIGNLGADPEIKTLPSGTKVATFSVATSETWKDKDTGEKREATQWHRVSIFNEGLVGVVEKYLHKGSKVYLEGQLENAPVDRQGCRCRKIRDRDHPPSLSRGTD